MDDTPSPVRAALLINTRSGRGRRVERIAHDVLSRRGLELVSMARVNRPGRLVEAVASLSRAGIDRLIVGGGDGTLSTVAPRLAAAGIVLGVLPLGTANDFARTLKIPGDLDEALAVAAGRHWEAIDLARANDVYFLNVASIGMSVAAARVLTPLLKQRLGPFAYAVAGARAFLRHGVFRFLLRTSDGDREGLAHQIVVANGRFYGGGVLVAQDSTLDDGALTAYTLGTRGRWEMLRTVVLQKMQVALDRPGDAYLRTHTLRVETFPNLPVNLDGEIRAFTPVEFAVEARALRVLVPEP